MESVVIYALSHIIECFLAYYYFQKLFFSSKAKHVILLYTLTYTVLFSVMFLHNPLLNIILFIVLNTLLSIYVYKPSIKNAIFYSFILSVFMLATELFVELIPHAFLYYFFSSLTIESEVIACFIGSKALYFISVILFIHHKQKSSNTGSLGIPSYVITVTAISFSILAILCYVSTVTLMSKPAEYLMLTACTLIIILVLVVIRLQELIQNKQEKLSEAELALQQERNANIYFEAVQEQAENRNIMIHDIKNHIMIIKELCANNNIKEATIYLNQLMELPALSRNVKLTPFRNINIILNIYVLRCEQLHISFSVDCDPAFVDFMKVSHLTAMFCNLLDNSIEAAQNCDEPFIAITLRYDKKIHTAKISIVNSCSQKPIFNSDNRLISSKPDHERHGLGVVSAERIVTLYNGNMLNYYDETTASFHTIIMLRNPEVL